MILLITYSKDCQELCLQTKYKVYFKSDVTWYLRERKKKLMRSKSVILFAHYIHVKFNLGDTASIQFNCKM